MYEYTILRYCTAYGPGHTKLYCMYEYKILRRVSATPSYTVCTAYSPDHTKFEFGIIE